MAIVDGLIVCVQLHGGGREGVEEKSGRRGGLGGSRLTDARLGILPSIERERRLCPCSLQGKHLIPRVRMCVKVSLRQSCMKYLKVILVF